jgi:hypothetical protein
MKILLEKDCPVFVCSKLSYHNREQAVTDQNMQFVASFFLCVIQQQMFSLFFFNKIKQICQPPDSNKKQVMTCTGFFSE